MIYRASALTLALLTVACGGDKPQPPPPQPITIPDPMSYAVQSRGTNGDISTPLSATDAMIYRRFDYGHFQATDSFLTGPATALTTWSYAPWREYAPENGDGGESYELQNTALRVTNTKHGGIPTTPLIPPWTALTTDTVDCAAGWTTYSPFERGCRTTINYPGVGPVDTVVSEHRAAFMERIFLGRGWGRLAWQTFRPPPTTPTPTDRCPDFGWNTYTQDPAWVLADCRVATNIEPATTPITGAQLWHP